MPAVRHRARRPIGTRYRAFPETILPIVDAIHALRRPGAERARFARTSRAHGTLSGREVF